MKPTSQRLASVVCLAALSACAMLRFEPDRSARAPVLDGFGTATLAITTASPDARRWFDQGMVQAYAFNETEAVRAFKAALAQDPNCAMCAWGVAYQLGPNINAVERGDLSEAVTHVDHALRMAAGASPKERALIEALALRYARGTAARDMAPLLGAVCGKGGSASKANPLDVAYAERMRALADQYPDDADVVSIYAEAELIATRDDWWNASGQPAGRIGEVADRLERALRNHTQHTGLNHYLIHTVDAVPVAQRAEAAADRLGLLAPMSPHLLHMPAHTYLNLGRFDDAVRVNQQALAADVSLAELQKTQGFTVSKDWRGHNGRFLWYAALMQGRGELALETARRSAERAAQREGDFFDYVRSLPTLTLLRLQRWDEVLREGEPTGVMGVILSTSARGVALSSKGDAAGASAALVKLEPLAATALLSHSGKDRDDDDEHKMLRAMIDSSLRRLQAEVAANEQRMDEAVAHQNAALTAVADIDGAEPPMLAAGQRLALGELQLRAQRWGDAEKSFRQDLAERPGSAWALRGLAQAVQQQGRAAEAAALRARADAAWAQADAAVKQLR